MTNKQAREILNHFIAEMERTGYGEIIRQVKINLQEIFKENNELQFNDYRHQLQFYLSTSQYILKNISNSNLKNDIQNINEILETGRLTDFEIELIDGEVKNLNKLPDYKEMIDMIDMIEIIKNETKD